MNVWSREGNKYKSVIAEGLAYRDFRPFADAVGANDIEGPFMVECCENKFDKSDVMFYIYYYDYDVEFYVNRHPVSVTPELKNIFRNMVKSLKVPGEFVYVSRKNVDEEEEEECDECRLVPRTED